MTALPAKIGDYLPERLLGRGGMAAVFLCRAPDGEPVALKWLDQDHPPLVRRFERECLALARVRHPSVVAWRGHGAHLGRPYLVMEYIEGSDLRVLAPKLHERPSAERYARCRAIGVALSEALEALHDVQLVHRDVKPSNVMVAEDGRVVLTDLGVVKDLSDPDAEHTAVGTLVGTLAYAAPEQVDGLRIDARADQFSLGATLYYLLTLQRPFETRGRASPAPPSHFDPGVPDELERLVLRLMASAPAQRFASMREVRVALGAEGAEGIQIAGRNEAVLAAARALQAAADGARVLVSPKGSQGSGRGWITELLTQNAVKRGIPVIDVRDEAGAAAGRRALAGAAPVIVIAQRPLDAPSDALIVDIPLPPLSLADLRRTVVGLAPRTVEPARVAERLLRLTGGLPSLLVPLLSRLVHDRALSLPARLTLPDSALEHLDELDLDEQDVLAALAVAEAPTSRATLDAALPVDVGQALAGLSQRGLVREADGLWSLSATLFYEAAIERAVDPEGLRQRLDAARQQEHGAQPPVPQRLSAARGALLAGDLRGGLEALQRAAAAAQASGDREHECAALCALGAALIDVGRAADARHPLADATALARVIETPHLRRLSHVLRAAAGLRVQPRDRGSAAAAMDRLLPVLSGAETRRPELADALGMALRAHAAGVIHDRAGVRQGAAMAEALRAGLEPDEAAQVQLALLRAALCRGDRRALEAGLQTATSEALQQPLRAFQLQQLRALHHQAPPPEPGPLAEGLSPAERAALIAG